MLKDLLKVFSKNEYKKHLYALILAGGGGTRLWPRSRNKTPKQFIKLFGDETLTQITVRRLQKIIPIEKIFIVTVSATYKEEILKEVPDLKPENIIVEPARRETGPAHALGALKIYEKDTDAVIVTEAADRLVKPADLYEQTLLDGAKVAYEQKFLIAMGIEPRYPHSGLGHIKKGDKYKSGTNTKFYKLEKFVEKPPIEIAKKYTQSGNYLWNAGQYIWRADTFLSSIEKHAPDIYKEIVNIQTKKHTMEVAYEKMPSISVDYAVAEKDKNFLAIEGQFFWTDIGDWREVWANSKKDNKSNVFTSGKGSPDVINIDSTDSLVYTHGRTVAIVGLDNVVVIDTEDALLVTSKSHAQSVKKVVEILKEEKRKELL